MAIPTVHAVGAANHGTGAVTYTLPTHATDDILVLYVECSDSAGVTAPTGWAHATSSPQAQGSNVTCANVMWKRATSSSETNPQVPTGPNHQIGVAVSYSGCVLSGNPWDLVASAGGGAGQTSISAAAGSTTVVDCLVTYLVVNNTDTTTNQFSSMANSTLSGFTEQAQSFTTDGNGGGVGVYTGGKATAGSTGTLTGSQPSGSYAWHALALKPDTGTSAAVTASVVSGVGSIPSPTPSGPVALAASVVQATASVPAPVAADATEVVNLLKDPSNESATWTEDTSDGSSGSTGGGGGPRTGTLEFEAVASGGGTFQTHSGLIAGGNGAVVTAGSVYSAGVYAKRLTGSAGSVTLRIDWYTSGNVFLSSTSGSSASLSGSYVRAVVENATAPATAAKARWYLSGTGLSSGNTVVLDDAIFNAGATVLDWFYGDTADAGGFDYYWTGSANSSTSVRHGSSGVTVSGAATVAATATVPSPTPGAPVALAPATVAGTASVPSATPAAGTQAAVTAAVVSAVASVPSPTAAAGTEAAVSPATVQATATAPAPTLVAPVALAPATVAATGTVPSSTEAAGTQAAVTASVVQATATVPSPTPVAPVALAPATVQATATQPAATPFAGQQAAVAASTVSATVTISGGAAAGGSADVPASTVSAVASVPAPTGSAAVSLSAATVTAVGTVGPGDAHQGVGAAPAAVQGTGSVPSGTELAGQQGAATGATVSASATVSAVESASTALTVHVQGTATVPSPAVSADIGALLPVTVQALATLAGSTTGVGAPVQATTVLANGYVPDVEVRFLALIGPPTVLGHAYAGDPLVQARAEDRNVVTSRAVLVRGNFGYLLRSPHRAALLRG